MRLPRFLLFFRVVKSFLVNSASDSFTPRWPGKGHRRQLLGEHFRTKFLDLICFSELMIWYMLDFSTFRLDLFVFCVFIINLSVPIDSCPINLSPCNMRSICQVRRQISLAWVAICQIWQFHGTLHHLRLDFHVSKSKLWLQTALDIHWDKCTNISTKG